MNLREALRLADPTRPSPKVAIVGAGGKTTALFQLARTFDPPVVVTTSTHLGDWQTRFADRHLVICRAEDVERNVGQLEGVTLLTGEPVEAPGNEPRLGGLDEASLSALSELATRLGFPVLVEADGARQRALKVPAAHEPAIPDWVDLVIVMAGLSGIGKPLDETSVHRPDLFGLLGGIRPGDRISMDSLLHVLTNPLGGLKRIPSGARKVAILNQAERVESVEQATRLASELLAAYDAAIIASLADQKIWQVVEPTVGIVLAAGGSTRFGQPKMLLPWRGKPLIRWVVQAGLEAGLAEVIVVTGAVNAPLHAALADLPVHYVENPRWHEGQSTSVRAGLAELPGNISGAVFLLADQPFVRADLIRELVRVHRETLAPVIAPEVGSRRANPVLFDRVTFPALLALEGDTGGRAVFDRFPPRPLPWEDAAILGDIDTPEDYDRLIQDEA